MDLETKAGRAHPADQAALGKIAKKADEQKAAPPDATPTNGKHDRKIEKRTLPVKLTMEQKAKKADEVAEAWGAVVEAENVLKAKNKTAKEKIKELKQVHAGIVIAISQGIDRRPVDCEIRYDFAKKVVEVHRLDLPEGDKGRVIEHRNLTDQELQFPLFAGDKGRPPEKNSAAALRAEPPAAAKETPKRYHMKGELCKKASCNRTHYDGAVLKKAGVKLSDEEDESDIAKTKESVKAAAERKKKVLENPDDWRNKDPKSAFRGMHEDDSPCYVVACELLHRPPKPGEMAEEEGGEA
jgi:hypothetical protein